MRHFSNHVGIAAYLDVKSGKLLSDGKFRCWLPVFARQKVTA